MTHPEGLDAAAKLLAWYFGASSAAVGERSSWRESGGYGTGGVVDPDSYTDKAIADIGKARGVRIALMAVGPDCHNVLACAYSPRQHCRSLRVGAGDDIAGLVIRVFAHKTQVSVWRASQSLDQSTLDRVRKLLPSAKMLLEGALRKFAAQWQADAVDRKAIRRRKLAAFEAGLV